MTKIYIGKQILECVTPIIRKQMLIQMVYSFLQKHARLAPDLYERKMKKILIDEGELGKLPRNGQ